MSNAAVGRQRSVLRVKEEVPTGYLIEAVLRIGPVVAKEVSRSHEIHGLSLSGRLAAHS